MYDSSPHALTQKLQERQAIFSKLSYNEKDRKKWEKVFTFDFMSSEESECSDADVILVRSLPWHSNRVSTFLHPLDDRSIEGKTPQAKRQMKSRRIGNASLRMRPSMAPDGKIILLAIQGHLLNCASVTITILRIYSSACYLYCIFL